MMLGMSVASFLWGSTLATGAAVVGRAAIVTSEGAQIDRELFELANGADDPRADRVFGSVTELGSLYAAGAAAGVMAVSGRRRAAAQAIAAAGVTWLIGQGVKRLVERPRPYDAEPATTRRMIAPPHGTSWPSSHPAVLTTFTRVAARELGLGAAARGALTALDLSVAASRVYLGVHYPSDVVSGLLIGRAVARVWPRWSR